MRKAIAIFVIWLVATISIPYSHIFSVAINGFALPAYGGVALAQTVTTSEGCNAENGLCRDTGCQTNEDYLGYCDTQEISCCKTICDNDGVKDAGEQCDGTQFGGLTCSNYGYSSGEITCNNCVISISFCTLGPGSQPSGGTGPYKICEKAITASGSSKEIMCNTVAGCPSGWQELSDTSITNGFADSRQCQNNLFSYLNGLNPNEVSVQPPLNPAAPPGTKYTVTTLGAACEDACSARTTTTTTLQALGGICSPVQPPAVAGMTFTRLTGNLCLQSQSCYCQYINPQQFFQGTPTSGQLPGGFNTASIPGSGGLVEDPAQIKNPPRFAANELDCNAPTNATIKANISLSTAPVGTLVTVSGEITKLTNACKGVSYSCRKQQQVGCRVQQGFFSTCVVYNACTPPDMVVYQSGGRCSINWAAIIGLILIAVSIYGAFLKDAALAAKISAAAAQAKGIITLFQSRSQDIYYAGSCNSICGQNTGDTPMIAAPTCNGYPIAAKEGLYQCRLGTCGGYEQKDVLIEIKDSAGKVTKRDSTRTDDFGAFSYTFPAPGPAGTYLIVVSTENPPPVLFNITTS